MSETKFTSGPYEIVRDIQAPICETYCVIEKNGGPIAIIPKSWTPEGMDEANACLLNAAPEMYLVIIAMLKCAKSGNMVKGAEVLNLMEEVIQKADGGQ